MLDNLLLSGVMTNVDKVVAEIAREEKVRCSSFMVVIEVQSMRIIYELLF